MLMRVLIAALRRLVKVGRLVMIDPSGRRHEFGDASATPVTIRLNRSGVVPRLIWDSQLALGEAYMDGDLDVLNGDGAAELMDFITRNIAHTVVGPTSRLNWRMRYFFRRISQRNLRTAARANVAHHYDLSSALYDLFLDPERQYSCAFFETPEDSIETAQRNKMRRIAAKLAIRPGDRVLDIGSGWGGLAAFLARANGARVTGVTLSTEQLAVADARRVDPQLADRLAFRLQDYRDIEERFDRIVSVGMLEHVGVGNYDAYFGHVARMLVDDGAALIHAIGRSGGPGTTNPWIAKYIFPGGYTPALSEVLPAIERAGLVVTDVEILRFHYAETLKAWRLRFMANRDKARALYDERFCRMWEFYLAGAEMGFRNQDLMVFQIQLAKRNDTLPIVRDYMTPGAPALQTVATNPAAVAGN